MKENKQVLRCASIDLIREIVLKNDHSGIAAGFTHLFSNAD